MADHDAGKGFRALWPTVILERDVPGHEAPNRTLLALIERLEARNPALTTDYRGDDFLSCGDPAAAWLGQCVHVSVRDYFAHLGIDYDVRWTLHAWPNVNRFGDYHDLHNHPRAYLSGTYYVQTPTDSQLERGRRDATPGRISLFDPRATANMTAIRGDPNVDPEHMVTPRPGLMLLWPAFVNHLVHPNLSHTPRVSVSFNVMLQWSDDYLPRQ